MTNYHQNCFVCQIKYVLYIKIKKIKGTFRIRTPIYHAYHAPDPSVEHHFLPLLAHYDVSCDDIWAN